MDMNFILDRYQTSIGRPEMKVPFDNILIPATLCQACITAHMEFGCRNVIDESHKCGRP